MKFCCEIDIDLPREKVIELFDNPENMKHWQPGLMSFEPLSGTPGQPGAKSRLKYKMGQREIEMIETITVRNLPDEFSGTYEAKGVFNLVSNHFKPLPGDRTLIVSDNEFRLSGFMKLFGLLMPGSFSKESYKHLQRFKEFAESRKE
jgi:hypothetical protein